MRGVLDRIGDQWSLLTLEALEDEKKRFNELMREIGDISKPSCSRCFNVLESICFE
ncbi:winged helix-turn-helix transcriptional regulator, partial [Rhizobium ruizarguesonis]